jgi:hypothetical protein
MGVPDVGQLPRMGRRDRMGVLLPHWRHCGFPAHNDRRQYLGRVLRLVCRTSTYGKPGEHFGATVGRLGRRLYHDDHGLRWPPDGYALEDGDCGRARMLLRRCCNLRLHGSDACAAEPASPTFILAGQRADRGADLDDNRSASGICDRQDDGGARDSSNHLTRAVDH